MIKVGLTGGIACGKTTVGRMFVELGARMVDADALVHELLQPGQQVHQQVVAEFGAGVLDGDGSINRKRLGELVFRDATRRSALNAIVHPPVIARQKEFLDQVQAADPGAVAMVDAALMIEAGTYRNYDHLVVVTCPPEVQRQRLIQRSGVSPEEADARIRSQMPAEEKVKFADFVIDTSGSIDETRRQTEAVWRQLCELAERSV